MSNTSLEVEFQKIFYEYSDTNKIIEHVLKKISFGRKVKSLCENYHFW